MTTKSPRRCLDCDRPMRPMRSNPADWPGTIIHQGRGLCSKHYKKRRASGTYESTPLIQKPATAGIEEPPPIAAERIKQLTAEATLFHRWWRKRNGRDNTAPINLREIIRAAA